MEFPRRKFPHLALGAAAPAVPRFAWAGSYPSRPIHFVVGFPAGGAGDLVARLIGNALSERLNQPIIIENRAGRGEQYCHRVRDTRPAGWLHATRRYFGQCVERVAV
jgi:tripartite-type tricarboxylate transporter receptor subunit TctC